MQSQRKRLENTLQPILAQYALKEIILKVNVNLIDNKGDSLLKSRMNPLE